MSGVITCRVAELNAAIYFVTSEVKKIVYIVRTSGGLGTEVPQWWDETSETPKQTEAEKANWSARIKAFLGIKK